MKDRQKKKKEGTNGVEEKERSYKQTNMRDKERANWDKSMDIKQRHRHRQRQTDTPT